MYSSILANLQPVIQGLQIRVAMRGKGNVLNKILRKINNFFSSENARTVQQQSHEASDLPTQFTGHILSASTQEENSISEQHYQILR